MAKITRTYKSESLHTNCEVCGSPRKYCINLDIKVKIKLTFAWDDNEANLYDAFFLCDKKECFEYFKLLIC